MKKLVSICLILMLALTAAASAETFRMGIDAEYPPYSYMGDDGAYTGYDVEMCAKVCEILGWDLEIVPINWDTKLIALDAGDFDCIWSGLTIDNTSRDDYSVSFAYSD
ncbi:MAG: amino acid ABC transporter substrate-binding protein, partial [Clostridiales bacterium]|nr:amino acid ABC transporter substrate-binding protein [Clostridiales bacterium]